MLIPTSVPPVGPPSPPTARDSQGNPSSLGVRTFQPQPALSPTAEAPAPLNWPQVVTAERIFNCSTWRCEFRMWQARTALVLVVRRPHGSVQEEEGCGLSVSETGWLQVSLWVPGAPDAKGCRVKRRRTCT